MNAVDPVRWRWSRGVAAAAIALLLFGQAVRLGAGAVLEQRDPDAALRWDTGNVVARLTLVDRALANRPPALDAADAHLDALARLRPADGRVRRGRGLVAAERGDLALAQELMQSALTVRPSDLRARVWLADAALSRADLADALRHLDAILRVAPDRERALLPALTAWLAQPAGVPAFADVLATRPPWRAAFLRATCRRNVAASGDTARALWTRMYRSPAPPTRDETIALVDCLIGQGAFVPAFVLWRTTRDVPAAAGNALHDGEFDEPLATAGFGWRRARSPAADATIATADAGRVLQVEFHGQPLDAAPVQQLVLLPPGVYRLDGSAHLDGLRSERGVEWVVDCAGASSIRLGASEPLVGSHAWRPFSVAFRVPADTCPAQRIALVARGRVPIERRIDGIAHFDHMKLTPASLQ